MTGNLLMEPFLSSTASFTTAFTKLKKIVDTTVVVTYSCTDKEIVDTAAVITESP